MNDRRPDPQDIAELLDGALQAHQAGELELARLGYVKLLQLDPGHAEALQLLATIEGQRGRIEQALTLLRRAVEYNPEDGRVHQNLGRALSHVDQLDASLACFQRALQLMPEHPRVIEDMGQALYRLNRFDEALACYEHTLRLQPDATESLIHRSEILQRMASTDPAMRDAAVAALRDMQAWGHGSETVDYALAALGAQAAPPAMPAAAVAHLFDRYAPNFEAHLTGTLGYRTPELIDQALQSAGADQLPRGRVIDLGCGTGLCAPWLRPRSSELVGVDLSAGMLERARARGAYDRLVCADLLQFLLAEEAGASLVVAADVFIYIGDLDAVFAATAAVLQHGGLFAFSLEDTDQGDYRLLPTRRYAHARPYVRRLAQRHGLDLVEVQDVVLRKESSADVAGTLHVLRRAQIDCSPEIDGAKK